MAKKTKFYETKHAVNNNGDMVCLYCGKTLPSIKNSKGVEFYHCDCPDAQAEYRILSAIAQLEEALPDTKFDYTYMHFDESRQMYCNKIIE